MKLFDVTAADKRRWRRFDGIALEVLCHVFDDGADSGMDEWLEWRNPGEWINPQRALGAFIRIRLNARACESCKAKERRENRRRARNRMRLRSA